jgi:hypothetical protein
LCLIALGCRGKSEPPKGKPAATAPDPFDPAVDCALYRDRVRPVLTEVAKIVVATDQATPEQLLEDVRAIDKQRILVGPAPFEPRALAHHRATLATFDGLVSKLQSVATLRGDGPKSPELQGAEPALKKREAEVDAKLAELATLCTR